jgi:malonyl-CoA O-methyltransferase
VKIRAIAPQRSAREIPASNTSRHISVADGYERWAPTYDIDPNPLLAREERYFSPLLDQLQYERVLDFGCGTGRWLRKLKVRAKNCAVGIDKSLSMLRIALAQTDWEPELALADCRQLPFPNSLFDLVISSFVLGHLANLQVVAAELARVTAPGAHTYVSDLHPKAYECGWRVGFRNGEGAFQIESIPHDSDTLLKTFHSVGFEVINVHDLWIGEPERPIFQDAGKVHVFAQACQVPAILQCHFLRIDRAESESVSSSQSGVSS